MQVILYEPGRPVYGDMMLEDTSDGKKAGLERMIRSLAVDVNPV